MKNEKNGEKGGRKMEGGENQPTESAEKKGLVREKGVGGKAGGVNEDKCTEWCLC